MRVKRVKQAYEMRYNALHKVVYSIANHINQITKETKINQQKGREVERKVKAKKEKVAKIKDNRDMKSLKLQQARKKLKVKISEFEQHYKDIIVKVQ